MYIILLRHTMAIVRTARLDTLSHGSFSSLSTCQTARLISRPTRPLHHHHRFGHTYGRLILSAVLPSLFIVVSRFFVRTRLFIDRAQDLQCSR